MATGVQPRDEDPQLTRTDLENIQDALKSKKFRDLLADYCEEVRDPANQALYQKEMTQLEKERGYDVTFINPKGGYVIKTSVAGDRKAFINICSNDNVAKPSCKIEEVNGQKGANWQIPYSVIPPREDYDQKKERCVIYDVVFHPDTLRMAELNKKFREIVNKTAFDGLQKTYDIHLDNNNLRFPKSYYKGYKIPAVIRKEDPNYKPPSATDEEVEEISPELLEKLYPQRSYAEDSKPIDNKNNREQKRKPRKTKVNEFCHTCDNGYTKPKYVIKQQKAVDMQEFTYDKNCKQYSAIPSHIVVEIYLPLLSRTKNCILDVKEKSLSLKSEKPAKYKLDISLPYPVNDDCGNAKFDKTRHMLIVTLPVVRNYNDKRNSLKVDSGVESEENSGSQSDDDNSEHKLVVELSSSTIEEKPCSETVEVAVNNDSFLEGTLGYILPPYTYNIMDDIVAFTFHVKNTEFDSVKVKKDCNKIYIKFTSIGAGFVPVHYAAIVIFNEDIQFDNVTGEPWDNNVILQLEISGEIPQKFQIGLSSESMTYEYFDMSQVKKIMKADSHESMEKRDEITPLPAVEVTNLGTETNIVVSSGVTSEYDEDDFEDTPQEKDIVFTNAGVCENGAKSILRKPMMRSFSESSAGDIASSMDYASSDCIPEDSSLKKTVRFNKVIAKQFYRYNSSIEGQKKKNQRKKNKKRSNERKSESEAEDDFMQVSKPRVKSALKERRDSGLADTSDAETECKYGDKAEDSHKQETETNNTDGTENPKSVLNIVGNATKHETQTTIWESETDKTTPKKSQEPIACDNIKHNTELYDPEKLNKGQYLEVSFKNDLIFDLDM